MAVYPSSPMFRVNSTRGKRLYAIRTETEGGYGQTRQQFTKARPLYTLEYDTITNEEYETLETFFLENQGTIFSFTHPKEGITYDVMFNMDELTAKDLDYWHCTTQVQLIGV